MFVGVSTILAHIWGTRKILRSDIQSTLKYKLALEDTRVLPKMQLKVLSKTKPARRLQPRFTRQVAATRSGFGPISSWRCGVALVQKKEPMRHFLTQPSHHPTIHAVAMFEPRLKTKIGCLRCIAFQAQRKCSLGTSYLLSLVLGEGDMERLHIDVKSFVSTDWKKLSQFSLNVESSLVAWLLKGRGFFSSEKKKKKDPSTHVVSMMFTPARIAGTLYWPKQPNHLWRFQNLSEMRKKGLFCKHGHGLTFSVRVSPPRRKGEWLLCRFSVAQPFVPIASPTRTGPKAGRCGWSGWDLPAPR